MSRFQPSWRLLADCADHPELDWFGESPAEIAAVKAICAACPVVGPCRQDAFDRGEPWGVRGGLDREDRLALGMVIPDPWHGTPAGVKAHGCDCGPCKTAHARDVAAWRSRRRWAATSRGVLVPIRTLDRPEGRGLHRAFPNQLFLDLGVAA